MSLSLSLSWVHVTCYCFFKIYIFIKFSNFKHVQRWWGSFFFSISNTSIWNEFLHGLVLHQRRSMLSWSHPLGVCILVVLSVVLDHWWNKSVLLSNHFHRNRNVCFHCTIETSGCISIGSCTSMQNHEGKTFVEGKQDKQCLRLRRKTNELNWIYISSNNREQNPSTWPLLEVPNVQHLSPRSSWTERPRNAVLGRHKQLQPHPRIPWIYFWKSKQWQWHRWTLLWYVPTSPTHRWLLLLFFGLGNLPRHNCQEWISLVQIASRWTPNAPPTGCRGLQERIVCTWKGAS